MTNTENHDHRLLIALYEGITKGIGKEISACRTKVTKLNIEIGLGGKHGIVRLIELRKELNKKLLLLEKRRKILLFWIRFMKALDEYATIGRKAVETATKLRQEQYMKQAILEYLKTHKAEAKETLIKLYSHTKEKIFALLQTTNLLIDSVQKIFFYNPSDMEEFLSTIESDILLLTKEKEISNLIDDLLMINSVPITEYGEFDLDEPRKVSDIEALIQTACQLDDDLFQLLGQFLEIHTKIEIICKEQESRVSTLKHSHDADQAYSKLKARWKPNEHIINNKSLLSSYEHLSTAIKELNVASHSHRHYTGNKTKAKSKKSTPTIKNELHMYSNKKHLDKPKLKPIPPTKTKK